jgi:NDP-sugar pyrophosphorylase family protein
MKGMILAAGEGKRLRPLTKYLPKPMLPVAGRPLLEHILIHLRNCDITQLAINLHHLPPAVMGYFGDGSRWGVSLRYSVQEQLLGSAGGVKRLQSFFDNTFLVYFGDIYTQADLRSMVAFHRRFGASVTLGLYHAPHSWNCDLVELSDSRAIVGVVRKPSREQLSSNLAYAGIHVLEPDVLDRIPPGQVCDFGNDLIPALLADGVKMAGYVIEDPLIEIGLPENYRQVNLIASGRNGTSCVPSIADAI